MKIKEKKRKLLHQNFFILKMWLQNETKSTLIFPKPKAEPYF